MDSEAANMGAAEKAKDLEALPQPQREAPPLVHTLYEELTETWQYVVADPITRHAVIIDPHLDNGPQSTSISTIAADRVLAVIAQNNYHVDRILHTHEPKEHPSSAWYIRAQLLQITGQAPHVQIGLKMAAVHRVFKRKYSMNDGSQWRTDFEEAFANNQVFRIGTLNAHVLHLSRGNMAFVIGQHVFAGASTQDLVRHEVLGPRLGEYHVYSSRDAAPTRRTKLTPVFEGQKGRAGKKLVIKYSAE